MPWDGFRLLSVIPHPFEYRAASIYKNGYIVRTLYVVIEFKYSRDAWRLLELIKNMYFLLEI